MDKEMIVFAGLIVLMGLVFFSVDKWQKAEKKLKKAEKSWKNTSRLILTLPLEILQPNKQYRFTKSLIYLSDLGISKLVCL